VLLLLLLKLLLNYYYCSYYASDLSSVSLAVAARSAYHIVFLIYELVKKVVYICVSCFVLSQSGF